MLVGAASHHVAVALGYLRGIYKLTLGRIYAASVAALYYVRELLLDRQAIWASNLFDIKESLGSLGLPLVVGAFVLSRVMTPEEDKGIAVGYAVLVFGTAAVVWFDVVSGLLVTMVKGV